jgi:hypothetical protein
MLCRFDDREMFSFASTALVESIWLFLSGGMYELCICVAKAIEISEEEMFDNQVAGPRLAYWHPLELLSAAMIV